MTQRSGSPQSGTGAATAPESPENIGTVAVVGRGRLGSVLVEALQGGGLVVSGPHGRGYSGEREDAIVLLCVPDAAITSAAALICKGPLVGHCSGATGLASIAPHRGFSIHPVMTFTARTGPAALTDTPAAVAGTDGPALDVARSLAVRLGMRPFTVAEPDRPAYHAATAMAANFLVTLESAAGTLIRTAGVDPKVLLPLAHAALDNWGEQGAAALTGPVSRGDQGVVKSHRQALTGRTPELLPMFDALVAATQRLAQSRIDETRFTVGTRTMLVVNTVSALRRALKAHGARSIGFVPTMGALHQGHLELLRRARADNDLVVLSVFVNPAQFNDPADLAAYPRTDAQDRAHAETAGVDIYFAPIADVVYPPTFTATVALAGPIVQTFEGAHRGSGHFHGVTTVVTKLLMMIRPDRPTSARRTPSSCVSSKRSSQTWTSRCRSCPYRRCVSRMDWRCPAATCDSRPRAGRWHWVCTRHSLQVEPPSNLARRPNPSWPRPPGSWTTTPSWLNIWPSSTETISVRSSENRPVVRC